MGSQTEMFNWVNNFYLLPRAAERKFKGFPDINLFINPKEILG